MTSTIEDRAPSWRYLWRQALTAILACLPWLMPWTPGPSPAVAPWLASALCGLAIALLTRGRHDKALWNLLAPCALVVLWAAWHTPTWAEPSFLAGGLGLLCISAAAGADRSTWRALTGGVLVAAAISSLGALVQYLGFASVFTPWLNYAQMGEAYANLRQPNQFATLCAMGMAIVFWGAPTMGTGSAVSLIMLLVAGSAASASRTGLLQVLLLSGLGFAWGAPTRRHRLLALVSVAAYALGTLLLPVVLEMAAGSSPSRTLWNRISAGTTCQSRIVLWSNVLALVRDRPWTGWGWGELDFAHFITLYPGRRFCEILDNAHNLPLHLAVELGLPVAFLICGGGLAWIWRQRPWKDHDGTRHVAWGILATVLLHSLLEYPLWYGPFQIVFGASVGWLLKDQLQIHSGKTPATRLGSAVVVALAGAVLAAAWDYWRVSQIYLPAAQRAEAWRSDPLGESGRVWLFVAQAKFAELTLTSVRRDNAASMAALAEQALHYSPEPRVVERLLEADAILGREPEAIRVLTRFCAAYPNDYEAWRVRSLTAVSPGSQD